MFRGQVLRALVNQRLTAAAEEIFGLFQTTIAEYEAELSRVKEENQRQREQLSAVLKPQVRLHRADIQQLSLSEGQVFPEQQEEIPSVDQEDPPEPPHIKEEQEELWGSQGGGQLEEAEFTFTPLPVKKEDNDEEQPQSSQLQQSEQMRTSEDYGGLEPARSSVPGRRLRADGDHKTSDRPFRCSECGGRFRHKGHLQIHMRCHTGEKPFSCSVCGKSFPRKENLVRHMRFHSGEKPFSCSFCKKRFTRSDHAVTHMRTHTGEKPFSCSICHKSFTHKLSLKHHMTLHAEET